MCRRPPAFLRHRPCQRGHLLIRRSDRRWAQDRQVQATVKVRGAYGRACCKEVELLIRMTITRNSITGYELNCSVVPAGTYLTLARWNGPLNNFTYLVRNATTCVNSDVLAETLARPPFRG